MAFNHVAFATKDIAATHDFYTRVMGFRLAKVVAAPTPETGGWARHVFYDTGDGELIAFWDLHDDVIGRDFPTDLNKSIGLPEWVNHIAFDAPTLDALAEHRVRWQEQGLVVAEVDHGFCVSIYTTDPNGMLVEFCCNTRPLTEADASAAERLLFAESPEMESPPPVKIYKPIAAAAAST